MPTDDVARTAGLVGGQPLTEAEAEGWIPKTCFKHGPPGRIGIELEFVVHTNDRPARHLDPGRLQQLYDEVDRQPLHSRFTVEPGGQVELSSLPAADLPSVISQLERDLAILTDTAGRHGARLVGVGIDPLPPPPRQLTHPRYSAMEAYFDRWGSAGRAMMRSTASVQVNVEAGQAGVPGDLRRRWDLLHAIGPALVAAFANSPSYPATDARWSGYRNLRQAIWLTLDPARCRTPSILATESLPDAWTRWVLDAPVLAIRRTGRDWSAPSGLSFRQWLRNGVRAVPDASPPTLSDLEYHLTTLFPPVRARGHFEVRYLDAQPGPWWRVAAAAVNAVLEDPVASAAAMDACAPLAGPWEVTDGSGAGAWTVAARHGLADRRLCRAARFVLNAASEALQRAGHFELAELTADYFERQLLDLTTLTPAEARPC